MNRRRLLASAAALALPTLLPAGVLAQAAAFPNRPIRVVSPFSPGGTSDGVVRLLSPTLERVLGQSVVLDNRPGAGGTLAAQHVATQAPDGYTLMLSNTAPIVTSPPLYPQAGYDPVSGFTHIAYLGATPLVIMVNPRLVPATDLQGLIAWIRAQPAPSRSSFPCWLPSRRRRRRSRR